MSNTLDQDQVWRFVGPKLFVKVNDILDNDFRVKVHNSVLQMVCVLLEPFVTMYVKYLSWQ